jgi:hypothetical protein
MPEKPFVQTNTESSKQLKRAAQQERAQGEQDKLDLLGLLQDPRFRRFVWRVLGRTNMFVTIWTPNGSELNRNAGRQEIGHWLWQLLEEARPEAMLSIMEERIKEMKDGNRSEAR